MPKGSGFNFFSELSGVSGKRHRSRIAGVALREHGSRANAMRAIIHTSVQMYPHLKRQCGLLQLIHAG